MEQPLANEAPSAVADVMTQCLDLVCAGKGCDVENWSCVQVSRSRADVGSETTLGDGKG